MFMDAYQKKIVTALLIATFLAAIEVTVISTAMPSITRDLGGMDMISWVFAAYLLTYAVMTPIFGKLADLFGRKRIFIVGVSIFLFGSAMCGFSQSMEQLIFFRGVQGIGAGALTPMTFTIVGDVFKYEQRAKAQAVIGSVWGVAGIFGPLVGGFFVDFFSWHWIFFINIPFGIVAMYLLGRNLQENIEKKKRTIDYLGALTFIIGAGALLYALLSGGTAIQWTDPLMAILLGIAVLFIGLFIRIQLRFSEPMVPLHLLKNKHLLTANLASLMLGMILIGLTAYLPLWVQGVLGLAAIYSGLTLIPMSLGWPLAAFWSSKLLTQFGAKPVCIAGTGLIALSSLALTFISQTTPNWMLIVIMFFNGMGFGFAMTMFTVIVQSSVGWQNRGAASSSNAFLRTLGQTLGITILGAVLNQYIAGFGNSETEAPTAQLASGLSTVFLLLFVMAMIAFLITFRLPKEEPEAARSE